MSSDQMTHIEKITRAATWYANRGWRLLPCFGITDGGRCACNGVHAEPKDIGKHPTIGEWNKQSTSDLTVINRWWDGSLNNNIAVHCQASGFIVIDIDPRSGGIESFEKFKELLGQELPTTIEALTGAYTYQGRTYRGRHIYFKVADGEQFVGNLKAANLPGIDIKHNGYVMVAPSRHGSGVTYDWEEGKAPWQVDVAEAPEFLLQAIRKKSRSSSTSLGMGDWNWLGDLNTDGEKVDINKFLENGIDEGSRAVDIYRLTCAIANKMGVDSEAGKLAVETLMIRFNHEKVRPPLELEGQGGLLMHVRRAIDFVANNPVGPAINSDLMEWARKNRQATSDTSSVISMTTSSNSDGSIEAVYVDEKPDYNHIGGAISYAAQNGVSIQEAFANGNVNVPKDPDALSASEGGTPGKRSCKDIGNGRRLVDSFGSVIRYTPGIGWFVWDGSSQYWRPDAENLGMQELSKKLPVIISSEVANYDTKAEQDEIISWADSSRSNTRLKAAIDSANSDPRIIVPVQNWDGDPELLGVQNGVINLRTGELMSGRPDLHITKRAPVKYTAGMIHPKWTNFINEATGGDKELQEWLQRAVGYTLTGKKDQDVLFLVYGPPGSGKNTFVEAVVKALGSQQYSWPFDSSILADSGVNTGNTDMYHLAELRGKRMVWVDELPESEKIKENSVKRLTGSSEISARSPGEKPFTFNAQAKLWITTNHRPMINDDAMWRRLRPIPWNNVPQVPDPGLKDFLFNTEVGLSSVLAWAVEGAIKYLGSGLKDPLGWCTAVYEAAEIYRKNEDRIGLFLEEETRDNEGAYVTVRELYATYSRWAYSRGEKALSQTRFVRKLQDKGMDIQGVGSLAKVIGKSMPLGAVSDTYSSNNQVNWLKAVNEAPPVHPV